LLERLAAFADSRAPVGRGARLGDVAPDLLRPHVRAVARAGRRLGPDAEAAELHRLRVRTKRLRYALETLRSLGDRSTRELPRRPDSVLKELAAAGSPPREAARA